MTVSSETLELLLAAGLGGESLLAVVRSIENDNPAAAERPAGRSAGAIRQQRYRDRNIERLKNQRPIEQDWVRLVVAVIHRDGSCVYCGTTEDLTADHVIPVCQGGPHDMENLVAACHGCNKSKGGRTPDEWAASGNVVASRYVTRVTAERNTGPAPSLPQNEILKPLPTPTRENSRAREGLDPVSVSAKLDAAQIAVGLVLFGIADIQRRRWRGMPPPHAVSGEQWRGFLDMRKSIRKTLTDRAYVLLCRKLAAHDDPEWPPGEIVDHMTENSWRSFRPEWLPKKTERRNGQRAFHERTSGWAARPGYDGIEPASLDD
ncbi:HNH endonuclease [Sphingomonas abietis]|uniref:HNH endonuclease signature motif containing protein n=1 Tax=Sphingomonas abietis TaxID=3012344 RepID=A0ABY7NQY8_9SPHN|nr:HNH endonuclease signature motif containing protein [Sphingomonas abietis]WBO23950.1 HNH endonuclease signature motif containing protein [Sphingomonas abietis]